MIFQLERKGSKDSMVWVSNLPRIPQPMSSSTYIWTQMSDFEVCVSTACAIFLKVPLKVNGSHFYRQALKPVLQTRKENWNHIWGCSQTLLNCVFQKYLAVPLKHHLCILNKMHILIHSVLGGAWNHLISSQVVTHRPVTEQQG